MLSKRNINLQSFDTDIPESLKQKYSLNGLQIRNFGLDISDLEINFNKYTSGIITTQILSKCLRDEKGKELSNKLLWELPIGKRIEILFRLAILSIDHYQDYELKCKNDSCQQEFGINIIQSEIIDFITKNNNSEITSVQISDIKLLLRKPNGLDQLKWSNSKYKNAHEAIIDFILTLINNKKELENDDAIKKIISTSKDISLALDKIDPLINLKTTLKCPYCDWMDDYFIDLNEFALFLLSDIQKNLLYTIHSLAIFYHWNERDIVALPRWRRNYYLKLIENEVSN